MYKYLFTYYTYINLIFILLFFSFEIGSRLALNSQSSCLYLLRPEITSICYHTPFLLLLVLLNYICVWHFCHRGETNSSPVWFFGHTARTHTHTHTHLENSYIITPFHCIPFQRGKEYDPLVKLSALGMVTLVSVKLTCDFTYYFYQHSVVMQCKNCTSVFILFTFA
jgi:hypothetical protein